MPDSANHAKPDHRELPNPWKTALRRFFAQAWVEITIGLLVVISVLLTMFEFALESRFAAGASQVRTLFGVMTPLNVRWMELVNEIITVTFIIELSLRYYAARSKRKFFSEFWLDIIATIPVFRVFRAARVLRLLRLIRLFRLMGVISRLSSHYPYVLRRGAIDFLMICFLLALAVTFGTVAITYFESGSSQPTAIAPPNGLPANGLPGSVAANLDTDDRKQFAMAEGNEEDFNLSNSFWFSLYTLFAGEPIPRSPRTMSGKIVSVFLMFMGLTIFAIFAGTVSAFMVDRLRMEGRVVEFVELQDHIVICGWTPKTEIIIKEYRSGQQTRKTPIVVITELPEETEAFAVDQPNVMFLHDDFTKVTALRRAGIENAQTCLVLSDTSGGRSEQDADARTILAALTVEKINESVYTCAELFNRSYATHLEAGKVNDYVVSGEYGAHMLAQAAMKRGLISVFSELLTFERGNEFYRVEIPASWVGTSFDEKLSEVRKTDNLILVAVHSPGGEPVVNPENYIFQPNDEVVVIGRYKPKLS
jgi:voltage-gated potassium channel